MVEKQAYWQCLGETLNHVIDSTEKALPSGARDERLMRAAFQQLRGFTQGQLRYFLAHPSPARYSSDYALGSLFHRAQQDLALLERAAHQRAWGPLIVQESLARADQLARLALEPASRWLDQDLIPLTYFSPTPCVRLLPYAPIALIGLPYTGVQAMADERYEPRDLLTLPRAAGAILLGHGALEEYDPLYPLPESAGAPAWSRGWTGSVWMDVYACLIAGPLAALYAQDVQLQRSEAEFFQAQVDRPAPLMIPKVYTRVLERMGLSAWSASLYDRWSRHLNREGAPRVMRLPAPVTEIALSSPCDEVYVLADLAFNALHTLAPEVEPQPTAGPVNWWHAAYSGRAAYAPQALEQLYGDFAQQVAQLPMRAQEGWHGEMPARDWPEHFIAQDRRTRQRRHTPAELARLNPAELDWLAVLHAGGGMSLDL